MDRETRRKLVDRYKDGYRAVSDALRGAKDEDLNARPAPGKWSAREIVHHLGDSEMAGAFRLRLLLAIDNVELLGYDQDLFAKRLYYDRPIEASLEAFKAARMATAELLDRMTDEQWTRQGTHTEAGPYPVTKWLEVYGNHAHAHAEQILLARASVRNRS